ncbi:hypothetical protein [Flavobacterium sp.]|nr:hypothetical protein [Flavobacterium sp.]
MNANTGMLIGLGVLGALIIASLDNGTNSEVATEPTEKPKVEPKKVQL